LKLRRKIMETLAQHGFQIQGLNFHVTVKVEKFKLGSLVPYEVLESFHNKFLVEGMDQIIQLMIGGNVDYWDTGNARTGVGTDATGENENQTGLIAADSYKAMDALYPNVGTSKTIIFKSTYTGALANCSWQEYIVDSGSVTHYTLLRIASDKGTKASGETWTLQITCVLANP
jgi:hypothetical protein